MCQKPGQMFGCNDEKGKYVPSYSGTVYDMGSPLDPENRNI